eukprot:7938611-Pyramimonas_sp.AAC.1
MSSWTARPIGMPLGSCPERLTPGLSWERATLLLRAPKVLFFRSSPKPPKLRSTFAWPSSR